MPPHPGPPRAPLGDTATLIEVPDLRRALALLVAQIPRGSVTTFGTLAEALGDRVAARWVAQCLAAHRHGPRCRCHRVVRRGGQLAAASGDGQQAAQRLASEGVPIADGRVSVCPLPKSRFRAPRPLAELKRRQRRIARRVRLSTGRGWPALVAGVDVSYAAADVGTATYALVEVDSGQCVWTTSLTRRMRFPYISGYLGFREVPLLVELIARARRAGRLAEVVLVDGGGVLHPRRAGDASHLGVAADVPTIGVTKSLLVGRVAAPRVVSACDVVLDGAVLGAALAPRATSRERIYVSAGHLVDLDFSVRVVAAMLRGRLLPEPLYWADRISRREAAARRAARATLTPEPLR